MRFTTIANLFISKPFSANGRAKCVQAEGESSAQSQRQSLSLRDLPRSVQPRRSAPQRLLDVQPVTFA